MKQNIENQDESQLQSENEGQEESGYDSSDISEESDKPQIPTFKSRYIINEESNNQILTLVLSTGDSVWYQGQIVAANKQPKLQGLEWQTLFRLLKINELNFIKLTNHWTDIGYFCLRRTGGGGKILILDENLYQTSFIIDTSKLLTINQDPNNLKFKQINRFFPYLQSVKSTQNKKLNICLQSNSGNLIFEKSLGESEKLYLGSCQIVACTKDILLNKQNDQDVLIGPGIVFLEMFTTRNKLQLVNPITLIPLMLTLLLLFIIIFVMTQI